MLIPLPPASVSPALARCRWPRWKFGTVSVRSSAAFMVTVTITRRAPTTFSQGVRPAYQPIRPRSPGLDRPRPRRAARSRRASRPRRPRTSPRRVAPARPAATTTARRDDALDERAADAHDLPQRRAPRRAAPAPRPYGRVRAWRRRAPARRPARRGSARGPRQSSSVRSAFRWARVGLPEDRRVHGQRRSPRAAATCDQPAPPRVPGLHADHAGEASPSRSFQVCQRAPGGVAGALAHDDRRTTGFCIATRASLVTSRALDTWPGASRPSGRTKCVSVSPSGAPPSRSSSRRSAPRCRRRRGRASAHAASFALWISAASTRSPTVSRSPGARSMVDSPTAAAWRRRP